MSSKQDIPFHVELTARAERDLEILFIEKHADSSTAARRWYLALRKKILSLEHMPDRGLAVIEDRKLRQLLHGRKPHVYRIIYRVLHSELRVHVLHIRHAARRALPTRRVR